MFSFHDSNGNITTPIILLYSIFLLSPIFPSSLFLLSLFIKHLFISFSCYFHPSISSSLLPSTHLYVAPVIPSSSFFYSSYSFLSRPPSFLSPFLPPLLLNPSSFFISPSTVYLRPSGHACNVASVASTNITFLAISFPSLDLLSPHVVSFFFFVCQPVALV